MSLPATPTSAGGRVRVVVENAARHLIVPVANFVLSYLVVTAASEAQWGEFVLHLVVVNLATHLLGWGNKEYLLRAFARDPDALARLWQGSLLSRAPGLLLAAAVVVALGHRGELLAWVLPWLVLALLYQSLDVVVLFLHRYRLALAGELAGLTVTASLLLAAGSGMDGLTVVRAWVLGVVVKTAIVLAGLAPRLLAGVVGRVERRHLTEAVPFVLIGLSGLLQSRVDLYVVALVLSRAEVGRYQVTISLFIAVQSLAAFVLMPFVRDLYRSPDGAGRRLERWLAVGGVVAAVAAVPAAWLVLGRLYGFELPVMAYVMGALTVPPIFVFLPLIYRLYKHGGERAVMLVNFAGAAVSLGLTVALLPRFGLVGALAAAAAAQWAMMVWFRSAAARRVDGPAQVS